MLCNSVMGKIVLHENCNSSFIFKSMPVEIPYKGQLVWTITLATVPDLTRLCRTGHLIWGSSEWEEITLHAVKRTLYSQMVSVGLPEDTHFLLISKPCSSVFGTCYISYIFAYRLHSHDIRHTHNLGQISRDCCPLTSILILLLI